MALASQSVRSQSMPRSSVVLSRGRRARQKRAIGIVLLAGVCVGIAVWAARGRDGAAGSSSGPRSAAAADNVVPSSPMGSSRPDQAAGIPNPSTLSAATPPSVSMLSVQEPTPRTAPGASLSAALPAASPTRPPVAGPGVSAPTAAADNLPARNSPPANIAAPADPAPTESSSGLLATAISAADRAMAQARPLEARSILNRALLDPRGTDADRAALRRRLMDLNQSLVFGPAQTPGDPLTETYRVVAGDNLVKITRKLGLITEPSLIARVNMLANPGALRIGQTLKVVRGPFHAVVDKSDYRMDLYAGATPSPTSIGTGGLAGHAEPGWIYICSFPVGLGSQGLTPTGAFTVKEHSKLINPHWVNPRTGEKFAADDPKNPIGERWLGLEGLDDQSRAFTGYGIHGTIEPESIGREMSMGCVRLNAADVERVYELLAPRVSVVKIVP